MIRVLALVALLVLLGSLPHCKLDAYHTQDRIISTELAKAESAEARASRKSTLFRRNLASSGNQNGTFQGVYYLSWTEIGVPPIVSWGNEKVLTDVSTKDDSPYVEVPLPFARGIPILGVERYRVYASSNGALHLGRKQACDCQCFMSPDCNFNSSYTGVIAGFLADLDPSVAQKAGTANATMTVENNADAILFTWKNFPFFSNKQRDPITEYNSFRIFLNMTGSIVIAWDDIYPETPSPGYLITGLRLPGNEDGTVSRVALSPEQLMLGLRPWKTTVPGIYPKTSAYPIVTSQFKSGNSFYTCPVSELVTVQAHGLKIGSNQPIKVAPVSVTCVDRVKVFASLSGATSTWLTDSTDVVECLYSDTIFYCDILALSIVDKDDASGRYNVTFGWKPLSSSSTSLELLLPWVVSVTIYKSTDELASDTCSENLKVPSGCAQTCPLFDRNTTCLGLKCPQNGFYYDANPLCKVSSSLTAQDLCSKDLVSDGNRCCFVASMDCNGDCYGPATNAPTKFRQTVCCLNVPGMQVDCLGVCNGDAKLDACGACNGNAPKGSQCGSVFIVSETGSRLTKSLKALPVTLDLKIPNYHIRRNITLFNPNSTAAVVTVSVAENIDTEANTQLGSPDVFLTFFNGSVMPAKVYIPPNTSWDVTIHLNLDALVDGSKSYAAKHLVFLIERADTVAVGRVTLSLDVSFIHCSVLRSRERCTNFPGCTFCFYPSGIAVFTDALTRRRLFFTDPIPEYSKQFNEVSLDNGVCADAGSRTANEACRSVSTYGAGEVATASNVYAIVAGAILMVATMPFLIKLAKRSGRIVHV